MEEPGSGWISRPEGSPAEEQPRSRAGSVRQKGCGKGFAAHASPAALSEAAAVGCQQQVCHGPPQLQRQPTCSHTHTQHPQLHIHGIYIPLCHTPCCLSPALNSRETSLVPHRELLLFVPQKWPLIISSSHPASTGLPDKTTLRLPLILIFCSKAGCTVPSISSAVAVEFTGITQGRDYRHTLQGSPALQTAAAHPE